MPRAPILAVCLVLAPLMGQEPTTAEWQPLFDGNSLDGWTQRGGKAHYAVVDGAIVGTTVAGTPNSFLCTERTFGDFELELEFKVDPAINSGVQIRSEYRPERNVVFGYQVEIDPSPRAWTAGIYDESRRGWIHDLKERPRAREAFKAEAWNQLRVLCVGDRLRTWLNDVPAADLIDSLTLRGFIALQVHGVGKKQEAKRIRWRNIRVRDLGHHEWRPLFDGASLTGWHATGGGTWKVEDARLVGTIEKAETRHGVLLSDARWSDATVRVRYRAVRGNSGLYFRSEPIDAAVCVHGLQAEIDPVRDAGMLYETGGRGRVFVPEPKLVARSYRADAPNTMTVSAHGGRIAVHLNGHRMTELADDPSRREGHFGLQLHGGQDVRIEIEALDVLTRVR